MAVISTLSILLLNSIFSCLSQQVETVPQDAQLRMGYVSCSWCESFKRFSGLFSEKPEHSYDDVIALTASYINSTILPHGAHSLQIIHQTQRVINDVEAALEGQTRLFVVSIQLLL